MNDKRFWELFHENGDKTPEDPQEGKHLFRVDSSSITLDLVLKICKKLEIDTQPTINSFLKTKSQIMKENGL